MRKYRPGQILITPSKNKYVGPTESDRKSRRALDHAEKKKENDEVKKISGEVWD